MKYNLNFGTSVLLTLPVGKLDLADWIVNFSCEQYVACTPASRGFCREKPRCYGDRLGRVNWGS